MGWVTTTSVGLGYRLASRVVGVPFTPMRCILSIGTTLLKEGLRVRVSTCIGNQRRRSQSRLFSGMRLTVSKTFRWAAKGGKKLVNGSKTKTKRNCSGSEDIIEEARDVVTMDAGLKYKDLAEKRLYAARTAFESAAVELRKAERGMVDADNYVKSLRSHCKSKAKNMQLRQHELFNDVVWVEHAACE